MPFGGLNVDSVAVLLGALTTDLEGGKSFDVVGDINALLVNEILR